VLLYHLWPHRLPGGFTGVDVFFVVSGFVITQQLSRRARTDSIRGYIVGFYARRIRRLAPAATLVLLCVVAATIVFEPVVSWPNTMRQVTASAIFVQNWQLAHDAVSYLSAEAAPSAVQHYWSLSVEEQFYVVWPWLVLLAGLAAARRRLLGPALIGLVTLVSFGYSLHITHTNPDAAYFVTPARVWQLSLGALLVHLPRLPRPFRLCLPWLGAAIVVAGFFVLDGSMPYPGWAGLVPVVGAALLLTGEDLPGRLSFGPIVSWRPIQWLGDVSYSVYLWHWPLIVILPAVTGHALDTTDKLAVLGTTALLAWLSYRYVETPFRTARPLAGRPAPVYAIGIVFVAASVVAAQGATSAASRRIDHAGSTLQARAKHPGPCFGARAIDHGSCPAPWGQADPLLVSAASTDLPIPWKRHCKTSLGPRNDRLCIFGPDHAKTTILLWGDSHSAAWAPAFARAIKGHDVRVVDASRDACPASMIAPTRTVYRRMTHDEQQLCLARNKWVLKTLVPTADRVYIANMTTDYRFPGGDSHQLDGYAQLISTLGERGVPTTMLEDIPLTGDNQGNRVDVPACLGSKASDCRNPRERALDNLQVVRGLVDKGVTSFDYIPDADRFCHGDYCYQAIGGISVYFDSSHLSNAYASSLGPWLWQAMQKARPVGDYFG
jgi:peptidoglycan/LPS O-acetylase OafA/YrhL